MITGLDDAALASWAIVGVVALPIAGALFALVMPGVDRLALRYVGMGTSVGTGVLAIVLVVRATAAPVSLSPVMLGGLRLVLDGLSAPLLLSLAVATPIALRSGAPRILERTQFYVVTVLFAEGLIAAALVVDSVLLRLAIATVGAVPLFALVALFGGPMRGTTTMRAALIWLIVDIVAVAIVAWLAARAGVEAPRASLDDLAGASASLPAALKPWVFLGLVAPGLVRLAAGPFSVWLASFLDEAPVSAAVLGCCGAAPLGAHLIVRVALPVCPDGLDAVLPVFAGIAALSVLLSGVIAIAERDLRRLLAQLLQAAGATAAIALLCFDERAMTAASLHVVATGASATLALTAVEAVERRFETRDAVDLAGLGHATPLLSSFLILGLLALIGIPALGAGTTLWATAAAVARSPGLVGAGLPPLASLWLALTLVGGMLLASAGVAGAARRLLQPAPRRARPMFEVLNFSQAARLFVPAAALLLVGLGAGVLIDGASGPAREIAIRARAGAGVLAPEGEPFALAPPALEAPEGPAAGTADDEAFDSMAPKGGPASDDERVGGPP
jgi:NADH-quinone oxidoreductase subunit M